MGQRKGMVVRLSEEEISLVKAAAGGGKVAVWVREAVLRAAREAAGVRALGELVETVETPEGPKKIFRDAQAWVVEEPHACCLAGSEGVKPEDVAVRDPGEGGVEWCPVTRQMVRLCSRHQAAGHRTERR